MPDYYRKLARGPGGRWVKDDVPNQKEGPMATRKDKDETDQEQAVDQREIQTSDEVAANGHTDESTGDPHASDSDLPGTGIDGEAFPDKPEPIVSEQTVTETNTFGTEYEQPKFRAVRNGMTDVIGISLFNWVGPEALTLPGADLDDFKAFVASL